ncbi:MAG: sensor histidine kinase, partial [Microthrixaceae bacterium]
FLMVVVAGLVGVFVFGPEEGGAEDSIAGSEILRATLVIGVVAAAVSLAFGRLFVRPLREMRAATLKLRDGDMSVELPSSRITEVDQLSTAFAEMTGELDRSLRQQAELESERAMFIAAIAHDLRTPLFSLRGYLEGLGDGVADTREKQERYLAIANEKAATLEALVEDLFEYTRLEYLDHALKATDFDLSEMLASLVESMQPLAGAAGVGLGFDAGTRGTGGGGLMIGADRDQLQRAGANLIDNAIRYTPRGGQVEVMCGVTGTNVWFKIADNGPGIAQEDLPHLFKPLYRGDSDTEIGDEGTGLGLAIAHRILTAHHGTLDAENTPHGGAVFTATLPKNSPEFS